MAKKVAVEVLEAGDGRKYMASDLKALPPAKAGTIIEVKAGPYAAGLVEQGLVKYAEPDVESVEVETAVPTDDLTTIDGLGKSSAGKLAKAGITTFAGLAEANAADLSEATGIAVSKLEEWQAAAQTPTEDGE